jgi:tellurite resistance protein TerC
MNKESFKNFWGKLKGVIHWDELSPNVRRTLVAVIGGTIVLIGIAMLVLPGPAVVVIPLGLTILASEFAWARRYVRKARELLENAKNKVAG